MKRKITLSHFMMLFSLFLGVNISWSQTVYTFSACGGTASDGPTQAQVNSTYLSTNLASSVTVTGGIQYWTVPVTGNYKFSALGAQGGGANGGLGASIEGEFTLTAGQILRILIGQQGITQTGNPNSVGGGGGTFVVLSPATTTSNILVIAGGGGGSASNIYPTRNANIGASGNNGVVDVGVSNPNGVGGINGNGGNKSVTGCSLDRGSGGGGFLTNGGSICQSVGVGNGGNSFLNGGQGGTGTGPGATGGFGGGGATWQTGFRGSGGGGGSFNSGTMQNNLAGVNLGNGVVIITSLVSVPNDAGISSIPSFTPLCTGTYPLLAIVNNFGNNLISGVTVGWSVNGALQTPYTLSTPLDTVNGVGANSQTVNLGNFLLDGSTVVKVWTSLPNNIVDTVNGNDTTTVSYQPMYVVATLANGINCNGGSNGVAQATVVNNTGGGMTYSWSNGVNGQYLIGVQAGTYTLTGTNGTCTDTASLVITQPSAVTFTDVTTGVQCNGDSTGSCTLTLSGGTPNYSVSWAAGGTGLTNTALSGGVNSFTISDANGCVTPGTITVTEPSTLTLTSTITPESLGNDGAIDLSVSGGTPTYSYLWSNAATSQDLSALIAGTYGVTVTDANGCTTTLSNVVNSVVGLDEKNNQFGFTLSPNPSSGQFTIKLSNFDTNNSVQIFDVLGKKIFESKNIGPSTKINLNERNGVYLVKITNGSNSHVERIVVKN